MQLYSIECICICIYIASVYCSYSIHHHRIRAVCSCTSSVLMPLYTGIYSAIQVSKYQEQLREAREQYVQQKELDNTQVYDTYLGICGMRTHLQQRVLIPLYTSMCSSRSSTTRRYMIRRWSSSLFCALLYMCPHTTVYHTPAIVVRQGGAAASS
jgi:hypothetical protein